MKTLVFTYKILQKRIDGRVNTILEDKHLQGTGTPSCGCGGAPTAAFPGCPGLQAATLVVSAPRSVRRHQRPWA